MLVKDEIIEFYLSFLSVRFQNFESEHNRQITNLPFVFCIQPSKGSLDSSIHCYQKIKIVESESLRKLQIRLSLPGSALSCNQENI
jgi:hypothetical protein